MVLARKKLKQKLHTLLPGGGAEGEAAAEARKIKVRLVASKRPRPKRPGPRPPRTKSAKNKKASPEKSPAPAVDAADREKKSEEGLEEPQPAVDVAALEEPAVGGEADPVSKAELERRRKERRKEEKEKRKKKKEKMRARKLAEAAAAAKKKSDGEPGELDPEADGADDLDELVVVDEAALAQKAEVERRREERRKEKKEKRRVRRMMEAEAAANKKSDDEAEKQDVEASGAAMAVPDDSEHNLDATKVEGEAKEIKSEEVKKIKSEEVGQAGVSDNPIVSQDSEQSIKKVYVGGIPYYSSEDDIRSFFEGCGSITALDCMTFPDTGKFRGIAILTFKTDAAAKRALALDGADMGGFLLKVQPYKANREKVKSNHEKEDFAPKMIEGYNRTYVGNLAWDVTEDDLRKFFSDCKISSIRFGTDKETGDFKGFAHVDFSDSTSLAIALKLDQNVIKGRPARIRCAVPKKENQKPDDNATSDSSKNSIRTCYECGTPGHLSFACPNKKVSEVISSENKDNTDSAEALSMKRRTCYECGVPGHISSACRNKKASEVIADETKANIDSATTASKKRRTCYECGIPGHLSSACPNKSAPEVIADENKANTDSATTASKKRRTCYECGIPGHLSSACPNKSAPEVIADANKANTESASTASKKRRTCYECGISGHLSSACPNKKATEINSEEAAKPVGGSSTEPSAVSGENKPSDDTSSAPPKKKKRRTCYECGIAGHLSSECPNKAK
ncbi:protein gar2-like [Triticum dicoccoides]|uniref:protein gar2-like n=1 Tax=Triticum dicoccoides TaxID=85692 RepID=UPI00188F7E4E|nr:protein gar2-like [Triticum dicoccoides]